MMHKFPTILAAALLWAGVASGCLGREGAAPAQFVWQPFQAEIVNHDVLPSHLTRPASHVHFDGKTSTVGTSAGDARLFIILLKNLTGSVETPGTWMALDAASWEAVGYGPSALDLVDERRWDETAQRFLPFLFVHAAAQGQLAEGQFDVTLGGAALQVSCTTATECIVQGPTGGQRWQDGRWQDRSAQTYRYTFSRERDTVFAVPLRIEAQEPAGPWRPIWQIEGLRVSGPPLQGRNVPYNPPWPHLELRGNGILPDGDPAAFPYPLHQALQDAKSCIGPNCDPAVTLFFLDNPDAIPRRAIYYEGDQTAISPSPPITWVIQFQGKSWMNVTIRREYPMLPASSVLVSVVPGPPFDVVLEPIDPEQLPSPAPQIDLAWLRTHCVREGMHGFELWFGVQSAKGEVGGVPQGPLGVAGCKMMNGGQMGINLFSGAPSALEITSWPR